QPAGRGAAHGRCGPACGARHRPVASHDTGGQGVVPGASVGQCRGVPRRAGDRAVPGRGGPLVPARPAAPRPAPRTNRHRQRRSGDCAPQPAGRLGGAIAAHQMISSRQQIEPGLLRVFTFVLALQLPLVSLALCTLAGTSDAVPDYMTILGWAQTVFLLIYLSVSRLRYALGRVYLPLALGIAAIGPVVWTTVGTALRLAHGLRGAAALVDPSRLYLWLLLPVLLICAQYGLRELLLATAGTSLLAIALAVPLKAAGGPDLTVTVQNAGGRFVVFMLVGSIVVQLTKAHRAQRDDEVRKRAQLAQYATTLELLAETRERNRLARDLHDTLAHTLSAVSVQLKALDVLWDSDPVAARATLRQTQDLTRG